MISQPCSLLIPQQVRLKCIRTLTSVYQHKDRRVSTPFIHDLAPPIIQHLLSAGGKGRPHSEADLALVLEGLRLVEALVTLAEEDTREWSSLSLVWSLDRVFFLQALT